MERIQSYFHQRPRATTTSSPTSHPQQQRRQQQQQQQQRYQQRRYQQQHEKEEGNKHLLSYCSDLKKRQWLGSYQASTIYIIRRACGHTSIIGMRLWLTAPYIEVRRCKAQPPWRRFSKLDCSTTKTAPRPNGTSSESARRDVSNVDPFGTDIHFNFGDINH